DHDHRLGFDAGSREDLSTMRAFEMSPTIRLPRRPHMLSLGTAVALALWSLCATPLTARADMLVNGSFEAGPAIALANPIYAVPAGNTALDGWTVASGTVCIVTDNYWVPISGHRSVALGDMTNNASTVPGSLQQ